MIRTLAIFCLLFVVALCAAKQNGGRRTNPTSVTVTVHAAPQQTFAGFGTSEMNFDGRFQQLPAATKQSLSKMIWTDLNFKILRLWFSPADYAAGTGLADFKRHYFDSGIVSQATQMGCTTLLLAPGDVPAAFAKSPSGSLNVFSEFSDDGVLQYAKLLANFIQQVRQQIGVQITATGILNEPNDRPIRFAIAQWPLMIKALRAELDARGLQQVAIVAPEASSCDDVAYGMTDSIKADAAAWASLSGIATHTYNMGATDVMKSKIDGTNKTYWQTESSTPGPEDLGNAINAATSAGRFISDLNHGVTHWVWFIGFEQADPSDNGTRLIRYDAANPGVAPAKFYKYYYLQQLSQAFKPGAVARQCTSSVESTMTWTYGLKPMILSAAAQGTNGAWSIAVQNFTSDQFYARGVSDWDRSQGGLAAKTINVTVQIEALAKVETTTLYVRRSTSTKPNYDAGTVRATRGVVNLTLAPLDLVTLTTAK